MKAILNMLISFNCIRNYYLNKYIYNLGIQGPVFHTSLGMVVLLAYSLKKDLCRDAWGLIIAINLRELHRIKTTR